MFPTPRGSPASSSASQLVQQIAPSANAASRKHRPTTRSNGSSAARAASTPAISRRRAAVVHIARAAVRRPLPAAHGEEDQRRRAVPVLQQAGQLLQVRDLVRLCRNLVPAHRQRRIGQDAGQPPVGDAVFPE